MRICLALMLALAAVIAGGCVAAPPIVMESGFQRKVITPCDNDILCFRHTYDVTWDNGCIDPITKYRTNCGFRGDYAANGYPVSYRSNEYIFETGDYGYFITLPAGGTLRMPNDKKPE